MNVLVKVSASISVYKICEVVSSLKKFGFSIKVCASKSSLNFVGAATWEALSGEKVFIDDFNPAQRMDHIYLNQWADVTVLAPATAKTLSQLSLGVGDGVLNTLWLARDTKKPYLIFPAMNPTMWASDAVSLAVKNLSKTSGVVIYKPDEGLTACGDVGVGRLKEPNFILNEILKYRFDEEAISSKISKTLEVNQHKKNILVTFGGTFESIDGVRQICNFSTGSTGLRLCEELFKFCKVTAFYSEKIKDSFFADKKTSFSSSDDLEDKLKIELKENHYDAIYHLAAVSDYKPNQIFDKKMNSEEDEVKIHLKKRGKILSKLKVWSKNKSLKVVSFKLTHNQDFKDFKHKIVNELESQNSDFIVHNTLENSRGEKHKYVIYSESIDRSLSEGFTKESLVKDLRGLLC